MPHATKEARRGPLRRTCRWPTSRPRPRSCASGINRFRTSLGRFFVDKQELIDLMVVAAIAQEPLLLVGPPGTAKSDLVLKFKDALGLGEGDYFEYMLTRFTEPSRSSAPSTSASSARAATSAASRASCRPPGSAFLDEIFKSNSAILNILLTIINEQKFYQDGVPQPVRLRVLFAATNEIPEQGELAALKDRFVPQGREPLGAGRALHRADRRRPAGRGRTRA